MSNNAHQNLSMKFPELLCSKQLNSGEAKKVRVFSSKQMVTTAPFAFARDLPKVQRK